METVDVTDLYQASYFLLSGCELSGLECRQTETALRCTLHFRGQHVAALEEKWFAKKAMANLWAFRLAYSQVNSYVREAKRNYAQDAGGRL